MKMSKRMSIALTTAALVGAIPFFTSAPVQASLQQATDAIAQALQRPDVKLQLQVEAQEKENWKELTGKVSVQPGTVLRYTVKGQNAGDRAAEKLVITQPVPAKTAYVLGSATSQHEAKLTYSIDQGKSFVEAPTVQVKRPDGTVETRPAPAEAYTHVRWSFTQALNPKAAIAAAYQVKVR
jgi:uncharacterized repeat protein (TIGR01451 family)